MTLPQNRRYAVVGTGSRAAMYVEALATTYADVGSVVAWCDPNPTRMRYYDQVVTAAGRTAPPQYAPDDFARLLEQQRPDVVIVTSPDATHHIYATAALDAGCDVVVEKPLTTSLEPAKAIVEAVEASSGDLVVTFNYRYSPRNSEVRRLIASGAIGKVTSIHFEWVLDTVHGADYFRRWHRNKEISGGLLVHKSSHHFDLVNWWLADVPEVVTAAGGLRFYGDKNAAERRLTDRPARSAGAPGAAQDPFALDLAADEKLRALYLDAEGDDGYLRDQDVFSPGITIEDNMGLLVTYRSGAILTYALNAHSPWEGYRVAINGTEGRLELDVVERGFVQGADGVVGRPAVDPSVNPDDPTAGGTANPRPAGERLLVQRHWEPAREVPIPAGDGAHGGGDSHLLDDVFRPTGEPDPLDRRAGYRDGLRSVAVGIAANRSLESGLPVNLRDFGLPLDREA
ncbi:oxidoreductase domain protein [Kribbella flavida DSM 17836]|uniref:Oxidoreductase domain protein n=1 Tax=Kribbella flavida (strain DSM 17836 / JCM 10339 / NBRC 14399) TaxID=479435 RepID=D2PS61_KRIFD|nr:Gfo/Idh/MocA family oxidoreductase [Kribbella flavida]ADB31185.1 oxidoreductase domain protein [Kribbella flavida DSM 17836]